MGVLWQGQWSLDARQCCSTHFPDCTTQCFPKTFILLLPMRHIFMKHLQCTRHGLMVIEKCGPCPCVAHSLLRKADITQVNNCKHDEFKEEKLEVSDRVMLIAKTNRPPNSKSLAQTQEVYSSLTWHKNNAPGWCEQLSSFLSETG